MHGFCLWTAASSQSGAHTSELPLQEIAFHTFPFQVHRSYYKDKKEKIKKIGWNIQNIENIIPNTNVILIGSKKFINEKVFELKERQVENLEIIACYNYNEVKNDMKEIVSKYDGMLNTLGINKI